MSGFVSRLSKAETCSSAPIFKDVSLLGDCEVLDNGHFSISYLGSFRGNCENLFDQTQVVTEQIAPSSMVTAPPTLENVYEGSF